MRPARIATAALLVAVPLAVAAQERKVVRHEMGGPPPVALRFELPPGVQEATVPFRMVNNHVILPVSVNGKGPFDVVLDTGMPVEDLALYDSPQVEAIGLAYLDNVRVAVGGAGGEGEQRPARMAEGVAYSIGDLKVLDGRAIVIPAPKALAGYHQGIIGAALFQHFSVSIDNGLQTITLRRPEAYQPPPGAITVPLTLERGMPFVQARVRTGEGPAVTASLVVDLGASHAVSLNAKAGSGIAIPEPNLQTSIGHGMSGELTGRVARVPELDLGGQVLRDVVATFPDEAHQSPRGMDSRDGNLGSGILSRFNVTFDYAEKRMVLVPARRLSEPFEWDMSGLQAEPDDHGAVRVRRVLPGSPADQVGIVQDDVLTRLDGVAVTGATFYELRDRLRRDGATVPVVISRNGDAREVTLTLRRLI
jgi:hypothetical protein